MASKIISVDPQMRGDEHYRYKMPEILVKVESSGNGIKTVFPNIRDVCERLGRPEEILIKYFGYELGTQSTIVKKDDKFILMGSHTQDRMQEKVDLFVTKFVLCGHCRNPETDVYVDGKNTTMICRSCGKKTFLSPAERAYGLFQSHYASNKAPASSKGMTSAAAATAKADAAAPAAAASAAPAAQMKTMVEAEPVPEENPIELLAEVLAQVPDQRDVHVRKVFDLKTKFALNDAFVVRLIFRAATSQLGDVKGKPFIGALQKHVELLKRFSEKAELQKVIIAEIEFACFTRDLIDKFPMAIKAMLEMNAVQETLFLQYLEPTPAALPAADKDGAAVEAPVDKKGVKKPEVAPVKKAAVAATKAPPKRKGNSVPVEVVQMMKERCAPLKEWINVSG